MNAFLVNNLKRLTPSAVLSLGAGLSTVCPSGQEAAEAQAEEQQFGSPGRSEVRGEDRGLGAHKPLPHMPPPAPNRTN